VVSTVSATVSAERDALAGKRELDVLPGLVDPPLDGREGDLERVGDLRVGEPDDVAEQERHLQVVAQTLDRAPDRVDRLDALERLVEHLERGDVVQRNRRTRPALAGPELVEHAVLRHLEEPGRERHRSEKFGRPWKTRRKTSCVRSSASDRSPTSRKT
jgi:hypothetical protein